MSPRHLDGDTFTSTWTIGHWTSQRCCQIEICIVEACIGETKLVSSHLPHISVVSGRDPTERIAWAWIRIAEMHVQISDCAGRCYVRGANALQRFSCVYGTSG